MAVDIQLPSHKNDVDLAEKGQRDDKVISLDRRLFMQFLAFGGASETAPYAAQLDEAGISGALYEDINDPLGLGLLTFSEDPNDFFARLRPVLRARPFVDLRLKAEYTMLGRTYSIGYEADLEKTLITRPSERVTDSKLPWAIWYPVRRSGAFEQLSSGEQRTILMEHGGVGRAYGKAKLAYDIRLACFGLDKNDNDFVIGLLGSELHPLSSIVERMRKTKQTSQYLSNLGPFFVGKAVWQKNRNNHEKD
jgi:chlorite dismutase